MRDRKNLLFWFRRSRALQGHASGFFIYEATSVNVRAEANERGERKSLDKTVVGPGPYANTFIDLRKVGVLQARTHQHSGNL
ncbi:protein of unknown function [Paraburkholderia dioscoreae]|uniref:Uncharacterized protein n=1 Tax=Paraburkholderia dioscoreae TaxID=2604047 RepID=A0A5Q4ZBB0_9BURK|nr:protein of unknown function [Paraburkholderia dioscoreae]